MARRSKFSKAPAFELETGAAWKVAIYLRLSVEDGDDIEQNSIGNQKKLCLAYLADISFLSARYARQSFFWLPIETLSRIPCRQKRYVCCGRFHRSWIQRHEL